jgi:hypothetical protein
VKIAHINVRDLLLKSKKDYMMYLLDDHKFDVLIITESWLFPDVEDTEVSIPGYCIFIKERTFTTIQRRGGICVYVSDE